ncbi:IS256 family transposase, partial [Nitrospinota bacterium]
MKRISPSERTRQSIRELLEKGTTEGDDPKSTLIRLAVRLMAEEGLEGKVADLLGRAYYEHSQGEAPGHRNGYRSGRLKSSEGEIRYASPQVRGADAEALSRLRALLGGRSEALESLAVEMFARGCSTRDVEALFTDEEGRSMLTRTAVSELTERLWEEYEAFATRDLSDIQPLYLFLDGLAERLTPGFKREAVLCAWCITWEGRKVLIHIAPGTKESTECCREFLQEMRRRGLAEPLLTVTDGAPGLMRAVEEVLPGSLRQRCLAHKMRNIAAKLPEDIRAEFEGAARAAYQAPSVAMARALREDLVERFVKAAPSAVRCFEEDFEACVAHLRCPMSHRRAVRTTNLLERLFGEERRRTKVAPTVSGERPVLKLMYASLIRASNGWRGIRITELERLQLQRLKDELAARAKQAHAPAAKNRP